MHSKHTGITGLLLDRMQFTPELKQPSSSEQLFLRVYLSGWDPNSCIKQHSERPDYSKADVQPFFLEMCFVPNGMNNLQISSLKRR